MIYTPIGKPHMVELFAIAAKEEANTIVYKKNTKRRQNRQHPTPTLGKSIVALRKHLILK